MTLLDCISHETACLTGLFDLFTVDEEVKCWSMPDWEELTGPSKPATIMTTKFWTVKQVPSYSEALEFIRTCIPKESNVNHVKLLYYDRLNGNKILRELCRDYDYLFALNSNRVRIISGVAGNGKTTLLKKFYKNFSELAQNAKLTKIAIAANENETNESSIPVYTTANDFICYFKPVRSDKDFENHIKHAVASIISRNKFEESLARHIFENRDFPASFILLLDAIDEVAEKYKNILMKVLRICVTVEKLKVIATCRTYYSAEVSDLCITSELMHLTWSDNHDIMVSKWEELGISGTVTDAENVLNQYREGKNLLLKKKFQFTPLFIEMISMLHAEYITSSKSDLTLAQVYKRFVKLNFDVYARDKIEIPEYSDLREDIWNQYLEAHINLALK